MAASWTERCFSAVLGAVKSGDWRTREERCRCSEEEEVAAGGERARRRRRNRGPHGTVLPRAAPPAAPGVRGGPDAGRGAAAVAGAGAQRSTRAPLLGGSRGRRRPLGRRRRSSRHRRGGLAVVAAVVAGVVAGVARQEARRPRLHDERRRHGVLREDASRGALLPGGLARPAACVCRAGWHGRHCSVPSVVHFSNLGARHRAALRPRAVPRRVVNAVNVNHEMELLAARLHELNDSVDVFLVCESNFTAFGDPRRLHLLGELRSGALDFARAKIHYSFLDHFPAGGRADGWVADEYLRTFATRDGLARLEGLRDDDVFVINDADEIPSREAMLFVRLHDGWPEPFALHLRRSLYGFFWKQPGSLDVIAGSTVAALREVYGGDGIMLRRRHYYDMPGFRDYERRRGARLEQWSVGTATRHAGWHCSWCFPPEGVRTKLVSAQNGDFPRWGDYPEKRDLEYIKNLIRTGGWFDGSGAGSLPIANPDEKMYAPWYVLQNPKKFGHLLKNPYL